MIEVVMTVPTPSSMEFSRDSKIVAVREKILKVQKGELPRVGGEGIVEKMQERVNEKNDHEGPDGAVAEQAADVDAVGRLDPCRSR